MGLLTHSRILSLAFAWALPLAAQSIEIHSEFQRIDPFGRVVAADRSEYPREILSPEVPRNAHSVFHISVTVPQNTSYFLYVGANPPNLVQTSVYKEDFERVGDQWIPDTLTPIQTPAFGYMPDAAAAIPGQTTRCYLLDIWVPPNADVRRMRVEVLLKIGIWYVAPMELRIGEARVPTALSAPPDPISLRSSRQPDVADRVDLSAMDCLARYLLHGPGIRPASAILTVRDAIRRSAEQDMAIARQHRAVPQPLWFLAENGILEWMMRTPNFNWSGAEWYLRVRDWIYRNPNSR